MITNEKKKLYGELRTQMLELAVIHLRCFKRFSKPHFKESADYFYQQAEDYKRLMSAVE